MSANQKETNTDPFSTWPLFNLFMRKFPVVVASSWCTMAVVLLTGKASCLEQPFVDAPVCRLVTWAFDGKSREGCDMTPDEYTVFFQAYCIAVVMQALAASVAVTEEKAKLTALCLCVHIVGASAYVLKWAGLTIMFPTAFGTCACPVRYAQWGSTTPIMLVQVFLCVDRPPQSVEKRFPSAVLAQWGVLVFAFVAELLPTPFCWLAIAMSCACFIFVLCFFRSLFKAGREKSPKSSEQPCNALYHNSLIISECVTYLSWSSFAIMWFLPFPPLTIQPSEQEHLFCWCDLISKTCAAVLFCNVDFGCVDRVNELQAATAKFSYQVAMFELIEMRTFQHTQKALNHCAKRGLSNVSMDMKESQDNLGEHGMPTEVFNVLFYRVMATCESSIEMCQTVELQRRVLLSQYTIKLDTVNMTELCSKLGYKSSDHFELIVDCPESLKVCVELLKPAMCNAVQNAKEHGQANSRVAILVSFDKSVSLLSVGVTNKPGKNHPAMVKFQAERGKNFLLTGKTYVDAAIRDHGGALSTFMGTDEVRRGVEAAGGTAQITFHDNSVETTLQFPATKIVAEKIKLCKPPKGLVFIIVDDDRAMRTAAKPILKHAEASSESLVFGDDYEALLEVVPRIQALAKKHGAGQLVCIFDQNIDIDYKPSISGQHLVELLGGSKFTGICCIRSGQSDPASVAAYYESGAKLVLDKAGSDLNVFVILDKLAQLFP